MLRNLALLFAALLVCLALGELGARLFLPKQSLHLLPQSQYDPSRTLGWVQQPSQDAHITTTGPST